MKVLIFGNLASGKSYLANKICENIPDLEYLTIDDFRRKFGDGSMEKENLSKQTFLNSIIPNKFQLIEASGFGDTGVKIAQLLQQTSEHKIIFMLRISLETCLKRLEKRVWNIPYPAPHEQVFLLAKRTNKLINNNSINSIWSQVKNAQIIEIQTITDNKIRKIIQIIEIKKQ